MGRRDNNARRFARVKRTLLQQALRRKTTLFFSKRQACIQQGGLAPQCSPCSDTRGAACQGAEGTERVGAGSSEAALLKHNKSLLNRQNNMTTDAPSEQKPNSISHSRAFFAEQV